METLYENKWCKIVSKEGYYILKSKSNKYNDQYFRTLQEAQKAIGIIPTMEKYTFNK